MPAVAALNRARLMLEVTDAVISVWGLVVLVCIIAPRGDSHSMGDSDPALPLVMPKNWVNVRLRLFLPVNDFNAPALTPDAETSFGGAFIANEQFIAETAQQVLVKTMQIAFVLNLSQIGFSNSFPAEKAIK